MTIKRKIKLPDTRPKFNTAHDTPLRYFSVHDVFVRETHNPSVYTLYSNTHLLIKVYKMGYIYIAPTIQPHHHDYVECFLKDYAPHISLDYVKRYTGHDHLAYIPFPELVIT